jgi:glycosyltransferase involved in cell wall biosynthesis
VTVITLTKDRLQLLVRAIRSVERQDYPGTIQHLVLIESDDTETVKLSMKLSKLPQVEWRLVNSDSNGTQIQRVAKLRNLGVKMAKGKWICFLDDDNEFTECHISDLISCAHSQNLRAVHSHRALLNRDGSPFIGNFDPWIKDREEAKRAYIKLLKLGVLSPGSNVARTDVDRLFYPDPIWTVDMGEWLLLKELLFQIPLREEFDKSDVDRNLGEDDKFLADLLMLGEPIACTGKATLLYYLGGFSNSFNANSLSSLRILDS